MSEPRILLYGHFGSGNIGNDSSLEAMLHAIRKYRPDSKVICICNGPDVVEQRFGIETLPMGTLHWQGETYTGNRIVGRIKRLLQRLRTELAFWRERPAWFQPGDQFMIVGTGAVDDMAVKNFWNAPYDLYKWCKAARSGGAQVMFVSVGVGPILNRISRMLMLRALRLAHYRSYREQAAFHYLKSIGYNTAGDHLYPDLVFSLPQESLPVPRTRTMPIVVGLGLIHYHGWRYDPVNGVKIHAQYVQKIKQFVSWLLDRGYTIRIISGDHIDRQPVQEIWEYVCDERAAQKDMLIVEDIPDVNELFAQIAQTDIVVASRFHNVLSSLMLERPVISLGYHQKNNDLMEEMGLGAYCQHIETFTVEKLIEQFEAYLANLDQATMQIRQRQQEYRRLLDEQYRNVLRIGESNKSLTGI